MLYFAISHLYLIISHISRYIPHICPYSAYLFVSRISRHIPLVNAAHTQREPLVPRHCDSDTVTIDPRACNASRPCPDTQSHRPSTPGPTGSGCKSLAPRCPQEVRAAATRKHSRLAQTSRRAHARRATAKTRPACKRVRAAGRLSAPGTYVHTHQRVSVASSHSRSSAEWRVKECGK